MVEQIAVRLCNSQDSTQKPPPEKFLLAAVLASGLLEAMGNKIIVSRRSKKIDHRREQQALKWVLSDEVYYSFDKGVSFAFICELLDVEKDFLRHAVIHRRAAIASQAPERMAA